MWILKVWIEGRFLSFSGSSSQEETTESNWKHKLYVNYRPSTAFLIQDYKIFKMKQLKIYCCSCTANLQKWIDNHSNHTDTKPWFSVRMQASLCLSLRHSLIWAAQVCAALKGMVFPAVLVINRASILVILIIKQGMAFVLLSWTGYVFRSYFSSLSIRPWTKALKNYV